MDRTKTFSQSEVTPVSKGAHYALQVALQTMKKRCQQLQRASTLLEDENISLKKQLARIGGDKSMASNDGSNVQEQIAVLLHQRNQLSQRLQLVVSENKQLWRRLAKLNQARQTLEVSLSQMSDTLKQHSGFPSLIANDDGNCLEEISLKLAHTIALEKLALEQQQSQVSDLKDSLSPDPQPPLDFADEPETLAIHYDQLTKIRDMLRQQQQALRSGLESATSQLNSTAIDESIQMSIQTWICPMCGTTFSKHLMSIDDFHMHVTSHFINENN
ncbi:protein spindle-F [Neocloeon triangulifer]|uniref:protein spindle-F n=1 Tax=Neocloeon triangulifer TaxID=2078957 RepID=UPI00286EE0A0|nr:protein spindle-F [Neocloeon triangulifer]